MGNGKKSKEQLKEEQRQRGYATYKKNLIPLNELEPEKRKEICQKGQRAMLEVVKKRKTIKEILDTIAGLNADDIADDYANSDIVNKLREVDADITLYDLIGIVQTENALKGSTKSAEFVRDSIGEKPKDVQQIDVDIITDSDRAMLENINARLDSLECISTDYKEV